MSFELHRNQERGHLKHGWLKTAHSFSFAEYVNPLRMHFGALLVLNEDTISPSAGFAEHGHDNMEIVTIPLAGVLQHADSLGHQADIKTGDVQIMSAGTGILHSEKNSSTTEPVHLLQIWVVPNEQGLKPRYDQITLDKNRTPNAFHVVVAPTPLDGALLIHQAAWFSLGTFSAATDFSLKLHQPSHGLFLFVIDGEIHIHDQVLKAGDALAIWAEEEIWGTVTASAHLLAIEVPLNVHV